jgi:hypothetical protein
VALLLLLVVVVLAALPPLLLLAGKENALLDGAGNDREQCASELMHACMHVCVCVLVANERKTCDRNARYTPGELGAAPKPVEPNIVGAVTSECECEPTIKRSHPTATTRQPARRNKQRQHTYSSSQNSARRNRRLQQNNGGEKKKVSGTATCMQKTSDERTREAFHVL